eukprot:scaffold254676_cov23-Tisochrysis_lutea.AAC.1
MAHQRPGICSTGSVSLLADDRALAGSPALCTFLLRVYTYTTLHTSTKCHHWDKLSGVSMRACLEDVPKNAMKRRLAESCAHSRQGDGGGNLLAGISFFKEGLFTLLQKGLHRLCYYHIIVSSTTTTTTTQLHHFEVGTCARSYR